MCLAVPMKLIAFSEAGSATAELDGVQYAVDTSLIEEPELGEYVIVHAGFAIEKLDEKEAQERLALFRTLAAGGG